MFPILFGKETRKGLYPYTRAALCAYLRYGKTEWHPLWETHCVSWLQHEAFAKRYKAVKRDFPKIVSIYDTSQANKSITVSVTENVCMRFSVQGGRIPLYNIKVNSSRARIGGLLISQNGPQDHRDVLLAIILASLTEITHWYIYKPHHKLIEVVKRPSDVFTTPNALINERLQALAKALYYERTIPAPSPSWRARAQVFAHEHLHEREYLFA